VKIRLSLEADRPSSRLLALLCAIGLTAVASAEPEPERLEGGDFAVGRALVAERPGSLQSVLLDYDVYRRSVEPELADLRVFDASGKPVPYAIRRRLPGTSAEAEFRPLPLFQLELGSSVAKHTGEGIAVDGYRIDAELSASGAILRVHRSDRQAASPERPAGWLLDASGLERAIVGLEFSLGAQADDFVSRLRLESSDDLARFVEVDADLALARLVQGGHRIDRTDFEIPRTRARYLRITPIDTRPGAELLGVRARLAPKRSKRERFRHTIAGRFDPERPEVVLFDLEASAPIEVVQVLLDEPNSIVEGRLESASSADGPWRVRQSGVFYYLEKGGSLRNPPAQRHASRDRHWRLVTSSRGGGLLGEPPSLELLWRPEQLLYIERGSGPSLLAVGRAGTFDGSFAPAHLLQMGVQTSGRLEADLPEASARLGPEKVLAGEAVLRLEELVPWRSYALWALLLTSVGVVLGLSIRLIRSPES